MPSTTTDKPADARRSRRDLYAEITDQITALLERGVVPWRRPWREHGPAAKRPYRGINQLLLQLRQLARSYSSPYWSTYRAAAKAGRQVRRGEKGTTLTFWRFLELADPDDAGKTKGVPFVRAYTLFKIDQIDGLEPPAVDEPLGFKPIERAEQIVAAMPNSPQIAHGGDRACYLIELDRAQLPQPEAFSSAEAYYSTAFDELVHSTEHESRLHRELAQHDTDPGSHSREELIAELGAAMLCGVAQIAPATIEASAAYIDHWLDRLRRDERMLVICAGRAQGACDYILSDLAEGGDERR